MGELRRRSAGPEPASGGGAEWARRAAKGAKPEVAPRPRRSCVRSCCRCMCFSFLIWSLLLTVGLFAGGWYMRSMWLAFWNPMGGVNFFLMRLFRDVSRAKARRRRFGQKGALMTLLRGTEAPF